MKDAVFVTTPLEIVIAKTKKGDAIRCKYAYGQKGQRDYYQNVRYLKMIPSKSVFALWWQGENEDIYKATGLQEFSKNGAGAHFPVGPYLVQPEISVALRCE